MKFAFCPFWKEHEGRRRCKGNRRGMWVRSIVVKRKRSRMVGKRRGKRKRRWWREGR
jgi:hypothetical protein